MLQDATLTAEVTHCAPTNPSCRYQAPTPKAQLEALKCCVQAWGASARLVRVHDDDTKSCSTFLHEVVNSPGSPMIVLSPGFRSVKWYQGLARVYYWEALGQLLAGGVNITHASDGSTWFTLRGN